MEYKSKFFGRHHSKFLPNGVKGKYNQGLIRTGWGNKGGKHVFRTAIGHKGSWYHTHIDWFKKFIFFPLFPFALFRRTKERLYHILKLMNKKKLFNENNFLYLEELLLTFDRIHPNKFDENSNIILGKSKYGMYIDFYLFSKKCIPLELNYNIAENTIYLALNIEPDIEGDIICDFDDIEKHFILIKDFLTNDIVEHTYYGKNNHILRTEYLGLKTGMLLYRDTNIRYYWSKIKRKQTKKYSSWIKE